MLLGEGGEFFTTRFDVLRSGGVFLGGKMLTPFF